MKMKRDSKNYTPSTEKRQLSSTASIKRRITNSTSHKYR